MFDYEGSRSEFLKLLAEFGEEPAFLARAKMAQFALESLLHSCNGKHEEMLKWPSRHLESLARRIAGDWSRVAHFLAEPRSMAQIDAFHRQLSFNGVAPLSWFTTEKGSLREYLESAARFNRGWRAYLSGIDYEQVNKPRRDYNQYYPLEKACAFGSERVSEGFQPLDMIDVGFLERRFPYLPAPELA